MTTIAYRAGIMAGDRKVCFGDTNDSQMTKVLRTPSGALVGAAGAASLCAAIMRWFAAGETEDKPPFKVDTDTASAMVVRPDGKIEYHDTLGWHEIEAEFYAIGAGYELALGAMAMGADAVKAVQIAARFNVKTGGEVDNVYNIALTSAA